MDIKQLSTNGYLVQNVFDDLLIQQLTQISDPIEIRTHDGKQRQVYKPDDQLCDQITSMVKNTITEVTTCEIIITAIEVWCDEPGYYLGPHLDDVRAQNIMIVYLSKGHESLGTMFYEDRQKHVVPYKYNSGLILLNSDKTIHGMNQKVSDINYRRAVYINWCTEQRYKELYETS